MILTHGSNSISRGGNPDFIEIGGRSYPYVQIGNQLWLAENLQLILPGMEVDPPSITSYTQCCVLTNPSDPQYSSTYGFLYTREAAVLINSTSGSLPEGWRVPSTTDLQTLKSAVSSDANLLKSTSGWYEEQNGTDNYGFNAIPSGYYNSGYSDISKRLHIMGVTNWGTYRNRRLEIYYDNSTVRLTDSYYSVAGTIRLIKDVA